MIQINNIVIVKDPECPSAANSYRELYNKYYTEQTFLRVTAVDNYKDDDYLARVEETIWIPTSKLKIVYDI